MTSKDSVLALLQNNKGSYISGQEIARTLNISRNSVWKAVEALRSKGARIEAVTNKGYRLESAADILSADSVRSCLKKYRDIPIYYFKEIDSTNKYAKKLAAEGAPEGTLVIAETQTSGRGRLGRSFFSPPGTGIYFSVILRPEALFENAPLITTAASVAVAESVNNLTGKNATIKWVNDVYIDGKKICGILTEAVTDLESGTVESAVCGIGINYFTPVFPSELRETAASVFTDEPTVSRSLILASVAERLLDIIKALPERSFMDTYRSLSFVIGKDVTLKIGNKTLEGRVTDIDSMGGLVADIEGKSEVFRSGEVTLRLKAQNQADRT